MSAIERLAEPEVLVVSYSFQIETFINILVNEHSTSDIKLNKTIQRVPCYEVPWQ